MQIEIVSVEVENKGKYRVANTAYKTSEGKVEGKKVMSFANKDVFKTISESKQGDKFDVKSQKNDNGYWEWVEAHPAGKNTGVESTNQKYQAVGKSFETAEERAKKQVYISRSASLNTAVALAAVNKKAVSIEDILKDAKTFEKYIFGLEEVKQPEPTEVK